MKRKIIGILVCMLLIATAVPAVTSTNNIDSYTTPSDAAQGGTQADWTKILKLTDSAGEANDHYGYSVSLDGDTALIGVYGDDNGKGSVYVFIRTGNTWVKQAKITVWGGAEGDNFGWSVALRGDTALIGAPRAENLKGAAYVWTRTGTTWTYRQTFIDPNGDAYDRFGGEVSLTSRGMWGDIAIIAAPSKDIQTGSVFIYARDMSGYSWTFLQEIANTNGEQYDYFGDTISASGVYLLIGTSSETVQAQVFIFSEGTYIFQQELTLLSGDYSCSSLSLSADEHTAIIGDVGTYMWKGNAHVFTRTGTTWTFQQTFVPVDIAPYDHFGRSVDILGDTALIGSPGDDDDGNDSGSVYVYTRSGTTWTQQQKLTASNDGAELDGFGFSVALGRDTAFIGAPGDDDSSGSAYVFTRSRASPIWIQKQNLLTPDEKARDLVGWSISVDGDTALVAAVGADPAGAVYVFTHNDGTGDWEYKQTLTDPNGDPEGDNFGCSVSLSGDTAFVGANIDDGYYDVEGSVVVFTLNEGTGDWEYNQKLIASDHYFGDQFGYSVSVSGDTAIIGALEEDCGAIDSGSVYVFTCTGTTWTQQQKLLPPYPDVDGYFGCSVSLDADNALIGIYGSNGGAGTACMFTYNEGTGDWEYKQNLTGDDVNFGDLYGWSVSLDDDTALIGAREDWGHRGSAYVFKWDSGTDEWNQQEKLIPGDGALEDEFGFSVSLSGDIALIGAFFTDDNGVNSGSAYVFIRDGDNWIQQEKLIPNDGATTDLFGFSVFLSGTTAFIGALGNDDLGFISGSVYIFEKPSLKIYIGGGFGVSAIIKNTGTTELTNIGWSINLDGALIFYGQNKTGTITSLAAGESITVRDLLIIGFGETGIAVKAGDAEANATGFVLLFFALGVE